MADVLTTGADISRGGMEANGLVVQLLGVGGLGLVAAAKLILVLAMALAAAMVHQHAIRNPSETTRAVSAFLCRSLQISVIVLVMVAIHNTALLVQIA